MRLVFAVVCLVLLCVARAPAGQTRAQLLFWLDADDFNSAYVQIGISDDTPIAIVPSALTFLVRSLNGIAYALPAEKLPVAGPRSEARGDTIFFRVRIRQPRLPAGIYTLEPVVQRDRFVLRWVDGRTIPVSGQTGPAVHFYISHSDVVNAPVLSQTIVAAYGEQRSVAVVDDAIAASLSSKFGNRPMWLYGDFHVVCRDRRGLTASMRPLNHEPIFIRKIERLRDFGTLVPLGSADSQCYGSCHQAYHIVTRSPLQITVDAAKTHFERIPSEFANVTRRYDGNCVSATAYAIDDWDFRRKFTTSDPRTVHPEWPAALRVAMLHFSPRIGMTRDMVAFAYGFPTDLRQLRGDAPGPWIYYQGSVAEVRVKFEHGIVTRIWNPVHRRP